MGNFVTCNTKYGFQQDTLWPNRMGADNHWDMVYFSTGTRKVHSVLLTPTAHQGLCLCSLISTDLPFSGMKDSSSGGWEEMEQTVASVFLVSITLIFEHLEVSD